MASTRNFHCLFLLTTEGSNWAMVLNFVFCMVVFLYVYLMFTGADLVMVHAWCYVRINCRVLSAMFCVDAVLQFNLQSCMGVFLYVYLMFTCSYCPCYGAIMSLSCSTILKKELWIKRSYGFVIS